MLRKTISLDDALMYELKNNGILDEFKNFSELVSDSLKQTLKRMKQEKYKKQILEAANDKMVQSDINEISQDFKYSDGENLDAF